MANTEKIFLLINLALAFYNVGIIWAHEVDIFRSWKLIEPSNFHSVQNAHWRKLPYWVFGPVGLAIIGAVLLIPYHPAGSPQWAIWANLLCQLLSLALTGLIWGRWQARLSKDSRGSRSPYLDRILRTHWVRTLLISACALILLVWSVQVL